MEFLGWVVIVIVVLMVAAHDAEQKGKKKRVDDAYKGFNPQPVHGQRKFETDDALKKKGLI